MRSRYHYPWFLDIAGYGENGRPIGKAFVVGIAGAYVSRVTGRKTGTPKHSHNEFKTRRWLRERKGTTALTAVNILTQLFTSPDPRRTSNRSEPRIHPYGYHPISSPFYPIECEPYNARHSFPFFDRIASTRNILLKNSNWPSRIYMTSTTLIR